MGREVKQKFVGHGWHEGKVVDRRPSGEFWVAYKEGDNRDLPEAELKRWLLPLVPKMEPKTEPKTGTNTETRSETTNGDVEKPSNTADEHWEIRLLCSLALIRLAPEAAAPAAPVLRELLEPKDLDAGLRTEILEAAEKLGAVGIPVVLQGLDDDVPGVQLVAVNITERLAAKLTSKGFGDHAVKVGVALRHLRNQSDDDELRDTAKQALSVFNGEKPDETSIHETSSDEAPSGEAESDGSADEEI